MKKLTLRKMLLCSLFCALFCVLAPIAIPIGVIPITLGTFVLLLLSACLSPLEAVVVTLLYLAIGFCGLPVFSGFSGGIGRLVGPTGGYLVSYPLAAFVCSLLARRGKWFLSLAGMLAGTLLCYTLGTVWFCVWTTNPLPAALSLCVLPFLPGDAIKIAAALFLSVRLRPLLQKYIS